MQEAAIWHVFLAQRQGGADLNDHTDGASLGSGEARRSMAENHSVSALPPATDELIELAVEYERQAGDSRNEALVVLQARGSREVLDAATKLCRSADPLRRCVGSELLGQLGWPR